MESRVIHGKMLRKELVWSAMDWIYLVQYREYRQAVLNTVLLLRFTKGGEFMHHLPVMKVIIIIIFFFFFSRRYNPWCVLACFMISFHNLLSLHFSLQFLTFIFFKSSSTWSSHLNLGLPTRLDEHGSNSVNFLTLLVVSILITCAAQRILCDFINLTIFFFLNYIF